MHKLQVRNVGWVDTDPQIQSEELHLSHFKGFLMEVFC